MEERNLRKTRVGVVVSDKMDKTISRAFLNDLDTLPKGLFIEDSSHRKPKERGEAR